IVALALVVQLVAAEHDVTDGGDGRAPLRGRVDLRWRSLQPEADQRGDRPRHGIIVSRPNGRRQWHDAVTFVTAPLPSFDSLRCFLEAARLLNFRAAARAVALTPAALGQRIAQLEGQIGRPLFHRTTRRVTLSEAGLALLGHAQRALEAADACVRAGRGETGPP